MSVDLAQALQDFSSTVDFIRKTNQQIYDVYVNPTPKDVTIYGPDGQVISSVPNRAKLVAEFEEWKDSARYSFVGTQLISANWSEITQVITIYGDAGTISLTPNCLLKHNVNAAEDGTPTQSTLYDKDGNLVKTLPLHPLASHKNAVFKAVLAHIESQDSERHFNINIPVVNKNPYTKSYGCYSQGQIIAYFSRPVKLYLVFVATPEYLDSEVYIDGEKVEIDREIEIGEGWHIFRAFGSNRGSSIAWNYLDLLRCRFSENDSLQPLDIVITHPSCLANAELSAILEKA